MGLCLGALCVNNCCNFFRYLWSIAPMALTLINGIVYLARGLCNSGRRDAPLPPPLHQQNQWQQQQQGVARANKAGEADDIAKAAARQLLREHV